MILIDRVEQSFKRDFVMTATKQLIQSQYYSEQYTKIA